MKPFYPRLRSRFRQAHRLKLLKKLLLPMMILLIISITTTFAQENPNYIYLNGQITNIENGAPVAGHPVYIESNNESNGGMNYYLAAITDANGFFSDTIATASLDGSLVIYTYDVNTDEYIKEEYYRFNWYSEYHMVTEMQIVDPNTLTDFQANFESEEDETDSLSYFFFDETIGEDIISWLWEFGDGTASTEQNPSHIYESPGVYDVKLTVSSQPFNNDVRISTIVKKVKAGLKSYYNFGGHAMADYFPVDIGTAHLYKVEGTEYIPIDTAEFDTLGYYYFYAMLEGSYIVKTFPSTSSVHAGQYLPTYYGNELLWTKAKLIELNDHGWDYDIAMVPNYEYGSGIGTIDGVVTLDDSDNELVDTQVILFNEVDNCLTYIKSNHQGMFKFSSLPYGTYKVLAEVPGMFTYPMSITLSEEIPYIENLSVIVYEEELPFGIDDNIEDRIAGMGNLYPNPAREYINFEFTLNQQAHVQIFILNQGAQVVGKSSETYNQGDHKIQLSTAELSTGMYRMMVLVENEKHIKSFIKVN